MFFFSLSLLLQLEEVCRTEEERLLTTLGSSRVLSCNNTNGFMVMWQVHSLVCSCLNTDAWKQKVPSCTTKWGLCLLFTNSCAPEENANRLQSFARASSFASLTSATVSTISSPLSAYSTLKEGNGKVFSAGYSSVPDRRIYCLGKFYCQRIYLCVETVTDQNGEQNGRNGPQNEGESYCKTTPTGKCMMK